MSKKVKVEVVKKIEDLNGLNVYLNESFYKKIVCCNIYDKFWGMVEVADPVIKRYVDVGTISSKVDFIAVDYTLIDPSIIPKNIKISSKPVYLLFHVR